MNENQLAFVRSKAKDILESLLEFEERNDHDVNSTNNSTTTAYVYDSWIRGQRTISPSSSTNNDNDGNKNESYPTRRCKYFDKNGFLLLKSFSDENQIHAMKQQMQNLVNEQWHPNSSSNSKNSNTKENSNHNNHNNKEEKPKVTVFRTDEKQIDHQGSDDYFLESANKVHFFAESKAMDEEEPTKLKPEFIHNKMKALNKAGHGLHMIQGEFHNYTKSPKIQNLVSELGWEDPVVPQSMYIFKQAYVGGEVTSHQDSTFLHTTPKQSCLGLWLALDDATLENGCLWVRPYSHREKVRRVFRRNPDHFSEEAIRQRSNKAQGDESKSQMIFTNNDECESIPWEGGIPKGDDNNDNNDDERKSQYEVLLDCGFVPIECKAGDLVVFPGELDHLSLPNHSEHQRHTFQLHLVEGKGAGVLWSESNWLQYPKGVPFLSLNED